MAYIIIFLFFITALLAFFEDRLPKVMSLTTYIMIGIVLILVAGLREIGIDADSVQYQSTYINYYNERVASNTDVSYIWLSALFNNFSSDVHVLFLFYAFWGVTLKFIAFRKLTDYVFLAVLFYLGFYFELHEVTQIRTGLMSGIFLLTIIPIAEKRRLLATALLLLGAFFHLSALALLPLLFFSNKKLSQKWKIVLAISIPFSYVVYYVGGSIIMNVDLPYIGNKLALYQMATATGLTNVTINVRSPFHLLTIFVFYYLLYFSDTITKRNKYFPLMMKIFAIGLCSYTVFGFLPVLSQRISYLFRIITIILFTNICYSIRPRWIAVIICMIIGLLYLNWGLHYINFSLLWEV